MVQFQLWNEMWYWASLWLSVVLVTPWCRPDPSIMQIPWSSMSFWHPKKAGKWPYPQHHHTHMEILLITTGIVSTHSSTWLYVTGLEGEGNWHRPGIKLTTGSILSAEGTTRIFAPCRKNKLCVSCSHQPKKTSFKHLLFQNSPSWW